jgi:hypothetical protein
VAPDKVDQVTEPVRKPSWKRDSIFAHSMARAIIHEQGGMEAAVEKFGPNAERLGKWSALKFAAKVTPKVSRVSGFIIQWAIAMRDESVDEYSITQYQRYWNEGERQTYRLQNEFREVWTEYETPNELARQIVKHLDAKLSKRDIAALPMTLQVRAPEPA